MPVRWQVPKVITTHTERREPQKKRREVHARLPQKCPKNLASHKIGVDVCNTAVTCKTQRPRGTLDCLVGERSE